MASMVDECVVESARIYHPTPALPDSMAPISWDEVREGHRGRASRKFGGVRGSDGGEGGTLRQT